MRALNYVTIIIGFLLVLGGILKYTNLMPDMSLNAGGASLKFETPSSLFYILIVHLIGGLSFIVHGLLTMNFKVGKLSPKNEVNTETGYELIEPLKVENWIIITGLLTIPIAAWECIYTIYLLSSFGSKIMDFMALFIFTTVVFVPFSLIPLILVSKNFSLYNDLVAVRRKQNLINKLNK